MVYNLIVCEKVCSLLEIMEGLDRFPFSSRYLDSFQDVSSSLFDYYGMMRPCMPVNFKLNFYESDDRRILDLYYKRGLFNMGKSALFANSFMNGLSVSAMKRSFLSGDFEELVIDRKNPDSSVIRRRYDLLRGREITI